MAKSGRVGVFSGDMRGGTRYGMLSLLGHSGGSTAGEGDGFQQFSRDSRLFAHARLGGVLHGRFAMGCDAAGDFWLQVTQKSPNMSKRSLLCAKEPY